MPSDVPGVLVAAGVQEIFASLGRIERANGFDSAERAYHAILRRALADGRDDIARDMTEAREEIVRVRKANAAKATKANAPTTRVRDLMQQKADEAQRNAQAAKMTEAADNARKRLEFAARREQEKISEHLRGLAGTPAPGTSLLGQSLQRGGVLNAGNLASHAHAPISGQLVATLQAQSAQYGD
jgi:hypothetical protein